MSSTLTRNTSAYRSPFRNYLFKLFGRFTSGNLKICLPDGSSVSFGDPLSKEVHIAINDDRFFDKCFLYGDVGFGEAYVEGYWESADITAVVALMIENLSHIPGISGSKTRTILFNMFRGYNRLLHLLRANNLSGARRNISYHYDLSNDFFRTFLDDGMTYSSGYFKHRNESLEEAQLAKYRRLWNRLDLQESDHVLEIGCGWGTNAVEMARTFGCKVTAITISEEQYKIAKQKVCKEGLEGLVEIKLIDYRNIKGSFSKIISIEMIEAVGDKYLGTYFETIGRLLKPNGIVALQAITCPDSRYRQLLKGTDWIQKHIFPGTLLPSVGVINRNITSVTALTLVDLKDLGLDYALTLKIWRDRFNNNLEFVKSLGFNEEFIRKWNYYLSYCEAAFATRNINVMQMIYSPPNNPVYK